MNTLPYRFTAGFGAGGSIVQFVAYLLSLSLLVGLWVYGVVQDVLVGQFFMAFAGLVCPPIAWLRGFAYLIQAGVLA